MQKIKYLKKTRNSMIYAVLIAYSRLRLWSMRKYVPSPFSFKRRSTTYSQQVGRIHREVPIMLKSVELSYVNT